MTCDPVTHSSSIATDASVNGLLAALVYHEGKQELTHTYARLHPMADVKEMWKQKEAQHQLMATALRDVLQRELARLHALEVERMLTELLLRKSTVSTAAPTAAVATMGAGK